MTRKSENDVLPLNEGDNVALIATHRFYSQLWKQVKKKTNNTSVMTSNVPALNENGNVALT